MKTRRYSEVQAFRILQEVDAGSQVVDAAFAKPEVYLYLEERRFLYAIRLPANDILERDIKHRLKRPEGELPEKSVIRYHDFQYQAKS